MMTFSFFLPNGYGRSMGEILLLLSLLIVSGFELTTKMYFIQVVDWATRGTAPKDRLVTLYRLSDAIADKLKSLFTLFAGHLVAKAADLLDSNNTLKSGEKYLRPCTMEYR